MSADQSIENLEQLLERVDEAAKGRDRVSLGAILDLVSHRSFGPVLLVAGLVASAPLVGDVPGVSILVGVLVFLVAGQLLIGRDHFWLPDWLLNRSVDKGKLDKGLGWMRAPAKFMDRLLRPRLTRFSRGPARYAIAVACSSIALLTPAMELVPFSANVAGFTFFLFGLALIGRDGLMALVAFAFTALTMAVLAYYLV